MDTSIVIRTYNEERYLPKLLESVAKQRANGMSREVIVVDSGSTDATLEIAKRHECRVVHIAKEDFSFGRSLNLGCEAATGDQLVFVSGHCVPASDTWLANLVAPIQADIVAYSYGRQLSGPTSKYSEGKLFEKYFPPASQVPQDGFFCNNANAALARHVWKQYSFDEDVPGLEDMHLAKRIVAAGFKVGYVAEAPVYHHHDETWLQVRRRYEREAIALQHIMPEVHLSFGDFLRYLTSAVLFDVHSAIADRTLVQRAPEIVTFRCMQFWGAYRGNHDHRRISKARKELYFYPKKPS